MVSHVATAERAARTSPHQAPRPGPPPEVPRRSWRPWFVAGALLLTLGVVVVLGVSLGSMRLGFGEAVRALVAPGEGQAATVVWSLRLPRVVVALLVGAALGGVGVVMQAVLRNPLADPGITGVSAGAAVGAVAGITLGLTGTWQWGLPVAAFAGSLTVTGVLLAVLRATRGPSTHTLILVGVAMNALAGAIISILVANAQHDSLARGAMFWLAGDLELRTWQHAALAAPPVLLGLAVLLRRSRALDALLLGEDVAATSGFDVPRTRVLLLLVACVVTGAAVAVSGVISFVGLVVPHGLRLVLGARHAALLPLSIVGGAIFLVLADTLARTMSGAAVLQTGAVCALVGAPVFLVLLLRRGAA